MILTQNIENIQIPLGQKFLIIEVCRWADNNLEIHHKKRFQIIKADLVRNQDEIKRFIKHSHKYSRVYIYPVDVRCQTIIGFILDENNNQAFVRQYFKKHFYNLDIDVLLSREEIQIIEDIINKYNTQYQTFITKRGNHIIMYDSPNISKIKKDIQIAFPDSNIKLWENRPVLLKYPD